MLTKMKFMGKQKNEKVGKAPAVKEANIIEIARPVEQVENPIAGRVVPSKIELNGKFYKEVDLADGSKTLIPY